MSYSACVACAHWVPFPRLMCSRCHARAEQLVADPTPWMLSRKAARAANVPIPVPGFFAHGRKTQDV